MSTNEINKNTDNKKSVKRIGIVALICALIVILICIVIKCDVFKSDGQKFVELLTKDQQIVKIMNDRSKDLAKDGNRNYNISLSKNFLLMLDTSFGYIGGDLVLDADVIKEGKKLDTKATLNLGSVELQKLDLIKEKDLIALSAPNIFSGFIAINDENVNEVAQKLGFLSEDKNDEIDVNEKANEIFIKYGKIFATSVNEYIDIEKSNIKINENDVKTNCYNLILDEKKLTNIELKLLEILKDDDDTIDFIIKCVNESENFSAEDKALLTKERLKEDFNNLYKTLLESVNELQDGEAILEIYVHENNGKNVRTVFKLENGENDFIIDISSISTKENDYILISFDVTDVLLNLKYEGAMKDKNYIGKLDISTDGASMEILNINVENVDSNRELRKIKELNALLLNEASDYDLNKFKNEIEINLGIPSKANPELLSTVYKKGEFKIDESKTKLEVLKASKEAYEKISPNMTKEDCIKILGKPSYSSETSPEEYCGWFFENKDGVYFISVKIKNGVIDTVYNDITSDMKNGVQVSTEIGTEIEYLPDLTKEVYTQMTKAEVINILGDKYVEIYKDTESCFGLKWYDKCENSVIIEFDNFEKVFYINEVTMDM